MTDAPQRAQSGLTQVAHYRLVTKLGEGGMGEVFLAIDTKLDRKVAVKVVRDSEPGSVAARRFEREAKSAAALDHPNILAIHDYGREDRMAYVVMELLEGQNLRDFLKPGPPPLRQGVALACDIADGLRAAHEKRILHRDLKPENIFVTNAGLVKILDFGLAKRDSEEPVGASAGLTDELATQTQLTSDGAVLGTAGYMSPEQIRGGTVNLQSDLFSFGSLLYEIVTGERAFKEESPVETMHAVLQQEPNQAVLGERQVPTGLRKIIERCTEKECEKRYADTAELCSNLRVQLEILASVESTQVHPLASVVEEEELEERVAQNSIAVLPFVNTSSDPETEYFSDGITEEIISMLSQVKGLRVAARTSSFAFKNQSLGVKEIGRQVNVETILEGSVRRIGDRVRITAQLINVEDGYQLWSQRYDRELDDVFAIQEDIATKIVQSLEVTLSRSSGIPLARHNRPNIEAYDLYLRGRYLIEQRGDAVSRGLGVLRRSIELDPTYAPAYAGVAEALILLGVYEVLSPQECMPQAKQMAETAIRLDDGSAEAHNCLAMIRIMWDWDWDGARDEFHKARNLNPNFTPAMYWYGLLYQTFVRGNFKEGLVNTIRATVIDPLGILPVYQLGLVLVCAGRYQDAVDRLEEGLARDPGAFVLYRALGSAYLGLGQNDKAISCLEHAMTISARHPWVIADLGGALARSGRKDEAEVLQRELVERREHSYTSSTMLSLIPSALGQVDLALDHLEDAVENRDALACAMRAWTSLAEVQQEPRFFELLERMKLPPVPVEEQPVTAVSA